MRQLPDQSYLAGYKSAVFLFRQPFLLIPGLLGTVASAAFFVHTMIATGHTSTKNVFTLLAIAPLTGFGFACLVGLPGFMLLRAFSPKLSFETEPGEALLSEEPANHFLHNEGRGGRLYLTDRRLVFVPHRFNIQRDIIQQRLADMRTIAWANVLGPSSLPMSTFLDVGEDGRTERYVVKDARELGARIEARQAETRN